MRDWDVLVVDDESVVRDAVRMVLEHEGLRVAAVVDAESGLAHPALDTCRLLICDLMLPGTSGLDLVRAARRRRPDLPIVVITGYATGANHAAAEAAGATFLPKPFDDDELLTCARHALGATDVAGEEGGP